ncbi:23S ribosomal RNA methyltransferase Erm [Paenibacillus nasutitermitis]|uniref:rRNA adenine N-6-methyltransferase n=1 Tax=Paenibacillus nasutitermitis TaxID=1652958 RepID=A0A916ZI26_9BACL|nr:23S ribosomal RNA methyltransferase Erm [Paenibacillus nasutitermitis]GGD97929.1 hypothetical protein GCM10010911_65890 [Paenibacillus nasutitermitis]
MNKRHKQQPCALQKKPALHAHGQHFLQNKQVVKDMIRAANIQPTDIVVDIGAGAGAITMLLAENSCRILAVENDPRLAETLRRRSQAMPSITVIEKDILQMRLPREPYQVIANIPFYLTTSILQLLLQPQNSLLQRAVLIMEKGAAKGFTSRTIRSPRLLVWRMWYEMEMVKAVPRGCFSPPPNVDSVMFRIQRKQEPLLPVHLTGRFAALAEYGLKHPDRSIYDTLNGIFTPPQLKHLAARLGVDRNLPVCRLNERQWSLVFDTMLTHVQRLRWPGKHR